MSYYDDGWDDTDDGRDDFDDCDDPPLQGGDLILFIEGVIYDDPNFKASNIRSKDDLLRFLRGIELPADHQPLLHHLTSSVEFRNEFDFNNIDTVDQFVEKLWEFESGISADELNLVTPEDVYEICIPAVAEVFREAKKFSEDSQAFIDDVAAKINADADFNPEIIKDKGALIQYLQSVVLLDEHRSFMIQFVAWLEKHDLAVVYGPGREKFIDELRKLWTRVDRIKLLEFSTQVAEVARQQNADWLNADRTITANWSVCDKIDGILFGTEGCGHWHGSYMDTPVKCYGMFVCSLVM